MQAAEYHERLANGAQVAAEAIGTAGSANGAGPSDHRHAVATADGDGHRTPAADGDRPPSAERENGAGRSRQRAPDAA